MEALRQARIREQLVGVTGNQLAGLRRRVVGLLGRYGRTCYEVLCLCIGGAVTGAMLEAVLDGLIAVGRVRWKRDDDGWSWFTLVGAK